MRNEWVAVYKDRAIAVHNCMNPVSKVKPIPRSQKYGCIHGMLMFLPDNSLNHDNEIATVAREITKAKKDTNLDSLTPWLIN